MMQAHYTILDDHRHNHRIQIRCDLCTTSIHTFGWERVPPTVTEIQQVIDGHHDEHHTRRSPSLDSEAADRLLNSPTWVSVIDFARRMEHKLSLHRDRGNREGWLAERVEWLFARGVEEEGELAQLMTHCPDDRDPNWAELVADECADRANLLMMLADKSLHDYPREY